MSLNTEGKGRPVCAVQLDGRNMGIVYYDSSDCDGDQMLTREDFGRFGSDMNFQVVPNTTEGQRDVISVIAKSGAGKTTWVNRFMLGYRKLNPQNAIYIFAPDIDIDAGLTIKDYKNVFSIDCNNPEFLQMPEFETPECITNFFSNCCVLFDDIDCYTGEVMKRLKFIIKNLEERARKFNCSVLITKHKLLAGKENSDLLNESTGIVIFPRTNKGHAMGFLTRHCAVKKKLAEDIVNINSRWIYYDKDGCFIIYEGGIEIID